jgi:hypothetical protein
LESEGMAAFERVVSRYLVEGAGKSEGKGPEGDK